MLCRYYICYPECQESDFHSFKSCSIYHSIAFQKQYIFIQGVMLIRDHQQFQHSNGKSNKSICILCRGQPNYFSTLFQAFFHSFSLEDEDSVSINKICFSFLSPQAERKASVFLIAIPFPYYTKGKHSFIGRPGNCIYCNVSGLSSLLVKAPSPLAEKKL